MFSYACVLRFGVETQSRELRGIYLCLELRSVPEPLVVAQNCCLLLFPQFRSVTRYIVSEYTLHFYTSHVVCCLCLVYMEMGSEPGEARGPWGLWGSPNSWSVYSVCIEQFFLLNIDYFFKFDAFLENTNITWACPCSRSHNWEHSPKIVCWSLIVAMVLQPRDAFAEYADDKTWPSLIEGKRM